MRSAILAACAFLALGAASATADQPTERQVYERGPQMLGLVQTAGGGVPLHCDGTVCSAQFSAFCLQESLPAPLPRTAYTPVPNDTRQTGVTLILDGTGRPLAADAMRIEVLRGYYAVRIEVPAAILAGAKDARLQVSNHVALAPDGPRRTDLAELDAQAAGAWRQVAAGYVDNGGPLMAAAHHTLAMVNALEEAGDGNDKSVALAGLDRVAATAPTDRDGRHLAHQRLEMCEGYLRAGAESGFTRCLEQGHDGFISRLNHDYWDGLKAGF